jgi:hypothetical protein
VTSPRWRSVAFALGCVLAGLALLGCFRLPSDPQSEPEDPPGAVNRSPGPRVSGQSLEGQFSHETMDKYVDAILPMISQWASETWPGMPTPEVFYVPRGATGPEACLDADSRTVRYSSASYEYCGADEAIYVGQDMLFTFYDRTGDAGPAVGLAHEYGHHVQQRLGVPAPQSPAASTRYENQADCLAGAWTRYTDTQGWLEPEDDLADIDALFPLIGSAEGRGRDHGTTAERSESFQAGFTGDVQACESFYPNVNLA